jgi:hypothetical protein
VRKFQGYTNDIFKVMESSNGIQLSELVGIQFRILSPEDVIAMSVCHVYKCSNNENSQKQSKNNQNVDPRLGTLMVILNFQVLTFN